MAAQQDEGPQLQIRCPSCGQGFQVGAELRDRTVECGACEHRFQVDEETIVRVRKVYPGERHDPSLSRFQRVPLAAAADPGVQTVSYGNKPDPAHIEPVSPQRILAGCAAVGGMIFFGLLLIFGTAQGGVFDQVPLENRLVMAGFAAILGFVALLYAAPGARLRAGLAGAVLGAGLISIPFVFTTATEAGSGAVQPVAVVDSPEEEPDDVPEEEPEDEALAELRERIGTDPLDKEIARLNETGDGGVAVGLYLIGLRESNLHQVRDYIIRAADAEPTTHPYPRDRGQVLLVVTGVDKSLQQMADIAAPLGVVEAIHPEIRVIEVRIDNEVFVEGPLDKLSDKDDPSFYALNKRELDSISLERVSRAVDRLAVAEPKIYRTDITRRLIELMRQEEVDFKPGISRALMVWAEQAGPASEAALAEVRALREAGRQVPPELMALAVKERNEEALPILDELWHEDPNGWEGHYGDFGTAAELVLLERFSETSGIKRHSAVRILGRIGGKASLPVLGEVEAGSDRELKVLVSQAEKSILGRVGN